MAATNPPPATPRIGILGIEDHTGRGGPRGCALWAPGYAANLAAAGATPVPLGSNLDERLCDELLADLHGLVFSGSDAQPGRALAEGEHLCNWCREHRLPLLAVDQGLHLLNVTYGGTLHLDLPRELPEALQHRHPPEKGLRHAICVTPNTRLAQFYGEGEIVVNSEHRKAVARVARGFVVSARALDGVIEALEFEDDGWFALGVQWQPAAESASGLDIQLFRGLVDAGRQWMEATPLVTLQHAA
jgi:putative glutamine amidotransferase